MKPRKYTLFLPLVLMTLVILILAAVFIPGHNLAVFNPHGLVASKERDLIILATVMMLFVVIPVLIMTVVIAWRYRADNTKATYMPDWDHNKKLEFAWWAIPCAIILALAIITWTSSHELDPFKPLASAKKPVTIQVVAMQWKWLFIYPEQGIATVNYVELPTDTPVQFQITADAPMNSFWIPQLAGQIYAMPGMTTQLHVIADRAGEYAGSSANLSGEGFAGMKFTAKAVPQADFDRWVHATQQAPRQLNNTTYDQLAKPSQNVPAGDYAHPAANLFSHILLRYTAPPPRSE